MTFAVSSDMKLRKYKLKRLDKIDNPFLAPFSATWECMKCGNEGPHTFHSQKLALKTTRFDICSKCDPEQWKEYLKKIRADNGKPG